MKTFRILALLIAFLFSSCQPYPGITLALLGDINLGRGVQPGADSLAELAASLAQADLVLANLESPLGDITITNEQILPQENRYLLCAPAERASFLAEWGVDLLSLANNHASDCALNGTELTRKSLVSVGLGGLTPEPTWLKINGLDLALLAFDDVSAPLDVEAATESIRWAHGSGGLVVVSIHWGAEYQGAPSVRQEKLAAEFAGAGAALVWGHHPHVLQAVDWIGSTLILYSLGNALFDQGGLADTRQSALILVTLQEDEVSEITTLPFVIDVPGSRAVSADDSERQRILDRLQLP